MDTSSPISKERKSLPTVRTPAASPYKQPLPNPKLTDAQKSAAKTSAHNASALNASQSSWLDVSLPDISAISSPEGPGALRSPERDPAAKERKAVEVWMKTAESGHAESQNNLAISYYRGAGVPKDDRKAVVWWSQAAQQGYAEAQYNLATCMMNGYGTGKDEESAVALFRAAADQEHPDAMCMVASFFTDGTHGVDRNLDQAVTLYQRAAEAGSEEAEYKLMVIEDLKTREGELNQLSTKISKINDGFIQLQLERAAHEEVTHAYKGAGFFLSNMKSEVPVRARIEMAQKAEKEIKHLRTELANRDKQLEETLAAKAAKEAEVQDLQGLVIELERQKVKQDLEVKELEQAKEKLVKDKQKQRKQIEDLLAESTELRTVAEWHKNQRVDALKQSLSAVVQTTINEQNEKEKALRSEIQKLRARLNQSYDSGPVLPGIDLDSEEHASLFLKRIRKDMFIQEALLKEILLSMRGADYEEQVELLREVMGQADVSERFLASAVDQILDHTNEVSDVTDEDALHLRQCLNRVMNSMGEIKTKSGWEVQKIKNENDKLRTEIVEMSEKLGMLTADGAKLDETDQRMVEAVQKQVQAMEEQARENEALLAEAQAQGHVVGDVQENLAQVAEAVKLLQREVRRSSSTHDPNSDEMAAKDMKILEELRRQHAENQELLRVQSAATGDAGFAGRRASMPRVGYHDGPHSPTHGERGPSGQRPLLSDGTATSERQMAALGVSPIRGAAGRSAATSPRTAALLDAEAGPDGPPPRSALRGGSRRDTGLSGLSGGSPIRGTRRQSTEGHMVQAQVGPEAMAELMEAMAAMKEGMEEKLEGMFKLFSEGGFRQVPSTESYGEGGRETEEIDLSDHGRALERLQRKVGKILDIVAADRGFDTLPSEVLSIRGHTASSKRRGESAGGARAGTPGSLDPAGVQEMEEMEETEETEGMEEGADDAGLVSPMQGRTSPLSRRDSMVSKRSMVSGASSKHVSGGGGAPPTGDMARQLKSISEQIAALVKAQKQSRVEETAKMRREVQMELTEKTLRAQALESENKALTIDLEKKELELKIAVQEREKAVYELQVAQKKFKEDLLNETVAMDERVRAAQEEAQNALDDRDRLMQEAEDKIKQKEKEMETRKELATQVMQEQQAKNMEVIKDIMDGFASKVALHLAVARAEEEDNNKGGGMSEEDLAALQEIIGESRREGAEQREEIAQLVKDLAEELRIRDKKNRRAGMESREGGVSRTASVEEAANMPMPPPSAADAGGGAGGAWPLDPEAMDAVKQDLHFAVAAAARRVMDQHKGGVVLLNLPDHNKPAGYFHGDGAGLLKKNMEEQRRLNADLRQVMEAMSTRMEKLEIKMEGTAQPQSISSPGAESPSARKLSYSGGLVKDALSKPASHKLLYAVKSPAGRQIGLESRMLQGLEKDQLREGVDEMRGLLQSWYRSFTLVSRLESAFELK